MKKETKNKKKINKNKINKNRRINKIFMLLGAVSFAGAIAILIITLYNNITLGNEKKLLEGYLTEYKEIKEEIDKLNNLKENYDLAKLNTENLIVEKQSLETKIKELNNQISNLNNKIDKLK